MSLAQQINTQVTLEGTARNAKAGAIVQVEDRTPVYVDGLERWDRAVDGKPVSASGMLRKQGADDVVGENGEHSTGSRQRSLRDRAADVICPLIRLAISVPWRAASRPRPRPRPRSTRAAPWDPRQRSCRPPRQKSPTW